MRGQGTEAHLAVGAGLLEHPVEKTENRCLGMSWTRLDEEIMGCPKNMVHQQELRQRVLSLGNSMSGKFRAKPNLCGYPRWAPELRVTIEEWVDFVS